jgi:hypothetical protein
MNDTLKASLPWYLFIELGLDCPEYSLVEEGESGKISKTH